MSNTVRIPFQIEAPRYVRDVEGRMGAILAVIFDSNGKPLAREHYQMLKDGKARMDQLGYLVFA